MPPLVGSKHERRKYVRSPEGRERRRTIGETTDLTSPTRLYNNKEKCLYLKPRSSVPQMAGFTLLETVNAETPQTTGTGRLKEENYNNSKSETGFSTGSHFTPFNSVDFDYYGLLADKSHSFNYFDEEVIYSELEAINSLLSKCNEGALFLCSTSKILMRLQHSIYFGRIRKVFFVFWVINSPVAEAKPSCQSKTAKTTYILSAVRHEPSVVVAFKIKLFKFGYQTAFVCIHLIQIIVRILKLSANQ